MNRFLTFLCATALAGFALQPAASAQSGTLDQSETHTNVTWGMFFFNDMQQDIRVGVAGTLEGFTLRMTTTNLSVGLPVAVFIGPGPHLPNETPAWSGMVFNSQVNTFEWIFVDCSAANLTFAVGDVFTIRAGDAVNFSTGIDLTGNSGWPNAYYPEPFYESLTFQTWDRLTFQTYMLPTPPTLAVTGSCPGSVTFDVTGGTGNYWLVYGNAGSSVVHGISLAISNPTLATTMSASLTATLPPAACGLTVQAVDMANMVASNPVVL